MVKAHSSAEACRVKPSARSVNGGEFANVSEISKTFKPLGMSTRDVFKLKQSWKAIKRNMEETGLEMFVR